MGEVGLAIIAIKFVTYWSLYKSMSSKMTFYVAAPIFAVVATLVDWIFSSVMSGGHLLMFPWQEMVKLLLASLIIFYSLERFLYTDTDNELVLPSVIFVGGFVLLLVVG